MSEYDVLLAERLERKLDLIRSELGQIRSSQEHQAEMFEREFRQIEACTSDHEERLRRNTEAVTQLKVRSLVSSGGTSLVSLAAFIKAFLGG